MHAYVTSGFGIQVFISFPFFPTKGKMSILWEKIQFDVRPKYNSYWSENYQK